VRLPLLHPSHPPAHPRSEEACFSGTFCFLLGYCIAGLLPQLQLWKHRLRHLLTTVLMPTTLMLLCPNRPALPTTARFCEYASRRIAHRDRVCLCLLLVVCYILCFHFRNAILARQMNPKKKKKLMMIIFDRIRNKETKRKQN
jgi:hypothetical protein